MSRLRRAAKAAFVVQLFNWAGLLLSLIAVPLYLDWLGVERYGLLLTGLALAGYLMFSDAGLSWSSMLLISHAHGREDREAIASILRNSMALAAVSALVVFVAVLSLRYVTALAPGWSFLPSDPETLGLLLAVGAQVVVTLFASSFYNLFIGLQEGHIAGIYQGSARIAGTLASLAAASLGAQLGVLLISSTLCHAVLATTAFAHAIRRHPWAFRRGSFWERKQISTQLRTGAKSFGFQIGGVLIGTAPIFAISSQAGPQFVPLLSIPLTLLNAPLSVVQTFNASLQAGYGEAFGKDQRDWIAQTIERILRSSLLLVGLLAAGYFVLAEPFIAAWTASRIQVSKVMLAGAFCIAVVNVVLGIYRFALSGMNRHKFGAGSEMLNGFLCLAIAPLVVRSGGFEWVGFGILAVGIVSSGWILPRETARHLHAARAWPPLSFLLKTFAVAILAWLVGRFSLPWVGMISTGIIVAAVYCVAVSRFLPDDWQLLRATLRSVRG